MLRNETFSGCGSNTNVYLKELDGVLESKSEHDSRFKEKISLIHSMYSKYSDPDRQFEKCMALAEAFSAYSSDSTFRYLEKCQKIASDVKDEYKAQKADFAWPNGIIAVILCSPFWNHIHTTGST